MDALLKWPQSISVKNATAGVTIDKIRGVCSTHGLSDTIFTDNAAVFASTKMK